MTSNQQAWSFVFVLFIGPALVVHLFPHSTPAHVASLAWITILFPLVIFSLLLFSDQSVRLRHSTNPQAERVLTNISKLVATAAAFFFLWFFTIPVIGGAYAMYIAKVPPISLTATVTRSSPVGLIPGLISTLKLSSSTTTTFIYWLPTTFQFDESPYKFTILPGTTFILNVAPTV